jgi:cytochrome c biogenesis protein
VVLGARDHAADQGGEQQQIDRGLLFLAIAAVPGSLFPQRSADPNGVIQWERDNPDVFPLADAVGLFDVYLSPWFSAIYLLLFTSLIGCVIPRAKHH